MERGRIRINWPATSIRSDATRHRESLRYRNLSSDPQLFALFCNSFLFYLIRNITICRKVGGERVVALYKCAVVWFYVLYMTYISSKTIFLEPSRPSSDHFLTNWKNRPFAGWAQLASFFRDRKIATFVRRWRGKFGKRMKRDLCVRLDFFFDQSRSSIHGLIVIATRMGRESIWNNSFPDRINITYGGNVTRSPMEMF